MFESAIDLPTNETVLNSFLRNIPFVLSRTAYVTETATGALNCTYQIHIPDW